MGVEGAAQVREAGAATAPNYSRDDMILMSLGKRPVLKVREHRYLEASESY